MKKKWYAIFAWALWWLFLIVCDLAAAHFIAMFAFRTVELSRLVADVLYGLVAAGLFGLVWFAVSWIGKRFPGKNNVRERSFSATIDALERIARGDFNVSLSADDFGPYTRFVDSINQMVRDLGTMETLRQDFVANVSHEIQSPLTSIGGYAALLENDALTPAEHKGYLDVIKAESARLSKLSANLLKLSALDAGVTPLQTRKYRLDKQLSRAVILLDPQWSAKQITVEAALDKVEITADEELLSQVWINLINNAIKFTTEGGRIDITLTASLDTAVCVVRDNGIGIAAEDAPRVFERFYKADKARDRSLGGNGLGLALVKKITELHGGQVRLESEQQKGTSVTVMIPFANL